MKRILPPIVLVGLVLLLWQLASQLDWLGNSLLASPKEVMETVQVAFRDDATKSQQFYLHALATIKLAFWGWFFSMCWGVFIGMIAGISKIALRSAEPMVEFFRAIPPVLVLPLFLVGFDFDYPAYLWTIIFGCMPIVILTVSRGMQQVNMEAIMTLKVFRANFGVRSMAYFMEILPAIFLSARLSFSFALIIAVVSEMVFTPRGGWALGALARDAQMNFDAPLFYTAVLTIGIFGYLVNVGFKKVEQKLN